MFLEEAIAEDSPADYTLLKEDSYRTYNEYCNKYALPV